MSIRVGPATSPQRLTSSARKRALAKPNFRKRRHRVRQKNASRGRVASSRSSCPEAAQRGREGGERTHRHRGRQRGPLEYTFFRPFPRLVFGCINADFCVQGRIFQRFSSSPFFLCTIPDFSDFSGPLHNFSQNLTQFSPNFKRDSRFCKSLSNFHRISSGFHRISVILIGVMSK